MIQHGRAHAVEARQGQYGTRGQDHGALHGVLQLAHVAGPLVAQQECNRVRRDGGDLALHVAGGALGITGAKFDAYDVWRDVPLASPKDALAATLDPHSVLTVALRAAAARPQVIGSTRHIVQGAVDIADETWDAATRTLRAKSVNLDSRAYAVTIAVPKGMRPITCKADVPCTVRRLESGHAVLEWAAGGDGRDIHWELGFRSTTARKGKG